MIIRYRDDPDLQNAIDGIQQGLKCCGGYSYHDWELNKHFNCSANTVQACGVPFSCCRKVGLFLFDVFVIFVMLRVSFAGLKGRVHPVTFYLLASLWKLLLCNTTNDNRPPN